MRKPLCCKQRGQKPMGFSLFPLSSNNWIRGFTALALHVLSHRHGEYAGVHHGVIRNPSKEGRTAQPRAMRLSARPKLTDLSALHVKDSHELLFGHVPAIVLKLDSRKRLILEHRAYTADA